MHTRPDMAAQFHYHHSELEHLVLEVPYVVTLTLLNPPGVRRVSFARRTNQHSHIMMAHTHDGQALFPWPYKPSGYAGRRRQYTPGSSMTTWLVETQAVERIRD